MNIWNISRTIILFLFGSIFLYILISFLLLGITPSTKTLQNDQHSTKKRVYLYYDFAHTEIIFKGKELPIPIKNTLYPYFDNIEKGYIAFSYGDESFMLHTPRWSDIKLHVAIAALFTKTPAVIRVGHYQEIRHDNSVIALELNEKLYKRLQENILQSFAKIHTKLIPVHSHRRPSYIRYFRAQTPYNLFNTCNTWTGDMLRHTSLPIPYWTPFAYQVVFHFLK